MAFARAKTIGPFRALCHHGRSTSSSRCHVPFAKYSGHRFSWRSLRRQANRSEQAGCHSTRRRKSASCARDRHLPLRRRPRVNFIQIVFSSHPLCLTAKEARSTFLAARGSSISGARPDPAVWGCACAAKDWPRESRRRCWTRRPRDRGAGRRGRDAAVRGSSEGQLPGEIWSLRLSKPKRLVMEDHFVDLRGIPPLLQAARACSVLSPERRFQNRWALEPVRNAPCARCVYAPWNSATAQRSTELICVSTNTWYQLRGRQRVFPCGPESTAIFFDVYESRDAGCGVVAENPGNGRLMGSCFYHPREHHVSLGIMNVHPNYFGRGVARRAAPIHPGLRRPR